MGLHTFIGQYRAETRIANPMALPNSGGTALPI